MVIAWDRLRENGQTSWDRDGGFVVSHDDIGVLRSIAATIAFLGISGVWLALDGALT